MAGETNLKLLLSSINPKLLEADYVFCTIKQGKYGDYAESSPLASYQEDEGLTLLLTQEQADRANLNYDTLFKGITLTVHSSLDSVGLTAVVATQLAEKGISANVIAAYYHDHIFVPKEKAQIALEILRQLIKKDFQG